eukprot:TRINITY_DN7847_c0_g1_i1.p1 TRINITY_DN7847_c0_g1~~TRINITY_DN7847_c0_g1_i1.p1  ORF type:complete len:358 (+),score=41.77 TRINITY_DN7847_c0_g1_i1:53-1126(+)
MPFELSREEGYSLAMCVDDQIFSSSGPVYFYCIRTCILIAIAALSLFSVLFSSMRVVRISKQKISYPLAILYSMTLFCLTILCYHSFASYRWLHLVIEFLKITAFGCVSFFFSYSAVRLYNITDRAKRPLMITFALYYVLVIICFGFAVHPNFIVLGCSNLPWVLFSVAQFLFALLFGVVSVLILRMMARKTTISNSFKVKHTRPLIALVLTYGFISTTTLIFRVYVYIESMDGVDCNSIISDQSDYFIWLFMLYTIVDMFLPVWAIIWYFLQTVQGPPQLQNVYQPTTLEPFEEVSFFSLIGTNDSSSGPKLVIKSAGGHEFHSYTSDDQTTLWEGDEDEDEVLNNIHFSPTFGSY